MSRPMVAVVTMVCALGCGAERQADEIKQMISRGDPVLPTTSVENDVTVYEYPPDAFDKAPQWRLEPTPVSTIGGAEGDPAYDLTHVEWVVPLSGGRVMTFLQLAARSSCSGATEKVNA